MEDIESMKYADLQKLAKSLGVKANQKMDKLKIALYDAMQVEKSDSMDRVQGSKGRTLSNDDIDEEVTIKTGKPLDHAGTLPGGAVVLSETNNAAGQLPSGVVDLTEKSSGSGNVPDELMKSNEVDGEIIVAKGRAKKQHWTTAAAGINDTTAAVVAVKSLPAAENKANAAASNISAAAKGRRKTVASAAAKESSLQVDSAVSKLISIKENVQAIDKAIDENVEATTITVQAKGKRKTVSAAVTESAKTNSSAVITKPKSAREVVQAIDETTYDAVEKFSSFQSNVIKNHGPSQVIFNVDKVSRKSSEEDILQNHDDDDEIVLQPMKRQKRSGDKLLENKITAAAATAAAAPATTGAAAVIHKSRSSRGSLLEKQRAMITQRRNSVHSRRVSMVNQPAAATTSLENKTTAANTQENKTALKTQIPRLHVDLKSKERSADYWARIHAKNFDKMDSLDDYMKKRLQRRADLLTPHEQQQLKTPAAATSGMQPVKPTTGSFVPKILTTKSLNLNFGQATGPRILNAMIEKPHEVYNFGSTRRSTSSTMKPGNSIQKPNVGNTSVSRKSIGMMSPDAAGDESSRKTKFDLKASLARPITWEAHRGALKRYEIDEKVQHGCIKAVKVKTKEERRQEAERLRQERRATIKSNNRNISSANISCA